MNTKLTRGTLATLTALTALTLGLPQQAAAASADLKVNGIIKPASCTPAFGDTNGVVDYGDIDRATIKRSEFTKLDTRTVPFTVSCNGTMRMAMSVVDNRAASKLVGLAPTAANGATEASMYGLGSNLQDPNDRNAKKYGAFHLAIKAGSVRGNGTEVTTVVASSSSGPWAVPATPNLEINRVASWAPRGTTSPGSYSIIAGNLDVTAVLNKLDDLPTDQEIALDGNATFEVKYF